MKKTTRALSLLVSLLLSASLLMTACTPADENPADTKGEDTTASETNKETPTDGEDTTSAPETEADTTPVDLTAEEVKTLLTGSTDDDTELVRGTITTLVTMSMEGETMRNEIKVAMDGDKFMTVTAGEGANTTIIIIGNTAYVNARFEDSGYSSEQAVIVTMTDEQKGELMSDMGIDSFFGEMEEEGDETVEAFLNADWKGIRKADGTVVLSCANLNMMEMIMGAEMEGAVMTMELTLNAEGKLTEMKMDMTIPAEAMEMTEDYKMSYEMTLDYAAPTIEAPADTSGYGEATYEEVFGGGDVESTIDPEKAAYFDLPLDTEAPCVINAPGAEYSAEEQFWLFMEFSHLYMDRSFTLYGTITTDEMGDTYLCVGDFYLLYPILLPEGTEPPANDTAVILQAVYSDVPMEELEGETFYATFMVVTNIEIVNAGA